MVGADRADAGHPGVKAGEKEEAIRFEGQVPHRLLVGCTSATAAVGRSAVSRPRKSEERSSSGRENVTRQFFSGVRERGRSSAVDRRPDQGRGGPEGRDDLGDRRPIILLGLLCFVDDSEYDRATLSKLASSFWPSYPPFRPTGSMFCPAWGLGRGPAPNEIAGSEFLAPKSNFFHVSL